MRKITRFVLWLLQLLSLGTILWCSWLLLDTTGFALVGATIVLSVTLYLEHQDLNGNTPAIAESQKATGIPNSE